MTSVGSYIATGLKTLAFSALDRSDMLNSMVNRITGGSVNRDTLAQSVFHDAVKIGIDYATTSKSLGERHTRLLPAIRQAAVDNDHAQMQAGVKTLMEKLLPSPLQQPVGALTKHLFGDHAVEKALASTVQRYGSKPLENYLQNMVGAYPGGSFAARQIMRVLDRSVLSKAEFQQGNTWTYSAAAYGLNAFLTGKPDDPPGLMSRLQSALPVVTGAVQTVRNGIDQMAEKIGLAPGESQLTDARAMHAKTIAQLAERQKTGEPLQTDDLPILFRDEITGQLSPRDVIATVVARQAVSESVLDARNAARMMDEQRTELDKALQSDKLAPSLRTGLEIAQKLVEQDQVKPLGSRGGTDVSLTLTGQLRQVQTANFAYVGEAEMSAQIAEDGERALDTASLAVQDKAGWSVADGYAGHVGQLKLELPASSYGYSDMARQGANMALNTAWSMMGWGSQLSTAQEAELRSLSNLCGNDRALLETVTRYLDPGLAGKAVADPVLQHVPRDAETGALHVAQGYVQLKDDRPEFHFSVQRHGSLISISMDAVWNIERFGSNPQAMLTAVGDQPSILRSTAVITVKPASDQGPVTVSHQAGTVVASIRNAVSFDLQTGSIQKDADSGVQASAPEALHMV